MPKKNSLFVDTPGWAGYINRKDPFHSQAQAIYQQAVAKKRELVTTSYVVAELVALLSSHAHIPRQDMIGFIDFLKVTRHVEIIYITPALDEAAWALLKARADKNWSLVDAASFVVMGNYGLTEALTTDQHFTQAGFARLLGR